MTILSLLTLLLLLFLNTTSCETDTYDDSEIVKQEDFEIEDCGPNEVWMVCSSCEQQCGKPIKPCPRICQPARCQCPAHKGYRRNEEGKCVFCHNKKIF